VAARGTRAAGGEAADLGFLGPTAHSAANEWVAALAQRLRDAETWPIKRQRPLGLVRNPRASAPLSTRRRWTVTGPGPVLFSADFSAGLSRRRSTMAPLDSQPAATILQTEGSRRKRLQHLLNAQGKIGESQTPHEFGANQ
jgi:hypothetical protein